MNFTSRHKFVWYWRFPDSKSRLFETLETNEKVTEVVLKCLGQRSQGTFDNKCYFNISAPHLEVFSINFCLKLTPWTANVYDRDFVSVGSSRMFHYLLVSSPVTRSLKDLCFSHFLWAERSHSLEDSTGHTKFGEGHWQFGLAWYLAVTSSAYHTLSANAMWLLLWKRLHQHLN